MKTNTGIAIISPKILFVKGLKQIVEEYLGLVNIISFLSINEFDIQAKVNEFSILFLDQQVGGFENLESSFFEQHNIVLITEQDSQIIYDLHKLELNGFITQNSQLPDYHQAIDAALEGRKYYSQLVIQVLIQMSMNRPKSKDSNLHENLSEREMEIFMQVTQGKSAKEIAEKLFISPHTVYTHRKNILKKLACGSAAELINYAYSQGLLEND
jgi:two-component system, NarL family, nitrate/nitrite response regulator NarL